MGKIQPTYQQSLFNDEQLQQPLHDRIVMWLSRQVRTDPHFVAKAACIPETWREYHPTGADLRRFTPTGRAAAEATVLAVVGPKPTRPAPGVGQPVWEFPIKSGRSRPTGFVDLAVRVSIPFLRLESSVSRVSWHEIGGDDPLRALADATRSGQLSFRAEGGSVKPIGDKEAAATCKMAFSKEARAALAVSLGSSRFVAEGCVWETNARWLVHEAEPSMVMFEAKTEIPTLGPLLRQLRLYKDTRGSENRADVFVVVAPRNALSAVAREELVMQGFPFLEYDGD